MVPKKTMPPIVAAAISTFWADADSVELPGVSDDVTIGATAVADASPRAL
jgi:hypothetical protein